MSSKILENFQVTLVPDSPELQPATLLNKGLRQRCFPVNFAKFLSTLHNTSGQLPLFLISISAILVKKSFLNDPPVFQKL